MTDANPAAGWYADPIDARLVRWWNGASWSEATEPAQAPAAPWADAAQLATIAPATEPATAVATWSPEAPQRRSASTPAVWLLAAGVPAVLLVLPIALFAVVLASPEALVVSLASADAVSLGLSVVLLVLVVAFAIADAGALRSRGYEPPSLLWLLLAPPIAYLIRRLMLVQRQGGRSVAPLVTYLVAGLGANVVATIVVVVMLLAAMPGLLGPGAVPSPAG